MSIDGCVTCCSSEIFVFTIGNVEMGFWVTVFFGESKVDYVDLVAAFTDTHEEVVGFDVAVDERFCVDVFDSGDLNLMNVSIFLTFGGINTSWSARSKTVLRENLRLQKLKRSSRDGPSKSITI